MPRVPPPPEARAKRGSVQLSIAKPGKGRRTQRERERETAVECMHALGRWAPGGQAPLAQPRRPAKAADRHLQQLLRLFRRQAGRAAPYQAVGQRGRRCRRRVPSPAAAIGRGMTSDKGLYVGAGFRHGLGVAGRRERRRGRGSRLQRGSRAGAPITAQARN